MQYQKQNNNSTTSNDSTGLDSKVNTKITQAEHNKNVPFERLYAIVLLAYKIYSFAELQYVFIVQLTTAKFYK